MEEKLIILEAVDPVDFFGSNNANFNKIQKFLPHIKLVARGNEIKIFGLESEIKQVESRINYLADYCRKHKHLPDEIIELTFSDLSDEIQERAELSDVITFGNNGKPIRALTVNQKALVETCGTNDLVFAIGPAGSGKTYTAIAMAVRALKNRMVKRIVLSRPAVEAGENLGYLPGDLKEKLDPYLQPLYDALLDMMPAKKLKEYFDENIVEIAPLAFMRGRTLDNAFVILDEAQNATSRQLKMFLTRMGRNARFIITGDITQIDLQRKSESGLVQAMTILKNIEGIGITEFDDRDIIRHRLVKFIVKAYEEIDNK